MKKIEMFWNLIIISILSFYNILHHLIKCSLLSSINVNIISRTILKPHIYIFYIWFTLFLYSSFHWYICIKTLYYLFENFKAFYFHFLISPTLSFISVNLSSYNHKLTLKTTTPNVFSFHGLSSSKIFIDI